MGIYELMEKYEKSDLVSEQIVGKIFSNLTDRRGVKQAIHECDDEVLAEMFSTLEQEVAILLNNNKVGKNG